MNPERKTRLPLDAEDFGNDGGRDSLSRQVRGIVEVEVVAIGSPGRVVVGWSEA